MKFGFAKPAQVEEHTPTKGFPLSGRMLLCLRAGLFYCPVKRSCFTVNG